MTITVNQVTLVADIDIKPGDSTNSIDLNRDKKIAVAIHSTAGFDATSDIDLDSLRFGATGTEDSLVRHHKTGKLQYSFEDVNGDGLLDLVIYFDVSLTGLKEGDTEAILRGELLDGSLLEAVDVVSVFASTKGGGNGGGKGNKK